MVQIPPLPDLPRVLHVLPEEEQLLADHEQRLSEVETRLVRVEEHLEITPPVTPAPKATEAVSDADKSPATHQPNPISR